MGRVKRWGEAESWTRLEHRWLSDAYEGAIGAARRDVSPTRETIEMDWWVVSEVEAGGVIELDRLPESIPAQDRKRIVDLSHLLEGERVDRQRIVVFEIPAVAIAYGTPKHQQTVEFVGRRLLAPQPFADRVMHRRASLLRGSLVALLAVPLTLGLVYLVRGAYFASSEVGGAALALAAAALLVYQGVRLATLGRRGAYAWFSLALLPVVAAIALAIRAEPDLRDAGRYVRSGKLDDARRELEALGSAEDAELASLYADVRLAELERATSADAAATWLALLPIGTSQRAAGQDKVDRRWIAEAAGQAKAGDPSAVAAILSHASPEAQKSAEARSLVGEAHILAGRRCLTAPDHGCAFEHAASAGQFGNTAAPELHSAIFLALRGDAEQLARTASTTKELGPRVDLLRQAKVKLLLLARYATEGERRDIDLAAVETRLDTDEPALEKQRAREAAERAREAERERKQAERIARAYERQARREAARRASEERRAASPMDAPSGGGCCKHCSKGKPCGDTCIARNKTCHVGRGCAC